MVPFVPDPHTGLPIGPAVDAAPAARPSLDIRLEGRTVTLVPLDPASHAAAIHEGVGGPDADRLYQYLFPRPSPDAASFQRALEEAGPPLDPFPLAILDRASGRALGHASYMRIEPTHRVIEVGNILYAPSLQRSVAATEAMYLMMRHAFEVLGYRRYEWKCNALNAPSRRAAARLGFTEEGVFRQHMIVKGRSRDTAWFSITDAEWPMRRTAFERWLAPANFDAAGHQILSLSALNATSLAIEGGTLRRATLADGPAFEALQQAAYAWNRRELGLEPVPLLTATADVLGRYEVWLFERDGVLLGALALEPRSSDLEIWSLSVDPAGQNDGLGRRLLAAAEIRARDLGLDTLRLFTGEKLAKNIDWYKRRGYGVERIEALPDRRLVHMFKTI